MRIVYYSPTPEAEGHLSIKVPPHDFAENIIGDETTIICHPSKQRIKKNCNIAILVMQHSFMLYKLYKYVQLDDEKL